MGRWWGIGTLQPKAAWKKGAPLEAMSRWFDGRAESQIAPAPQKAVPATKWGGWFVCRQPRQTCCSYSVVWASASDADSHPCHWYYLRIREMMKNHSWHSLKGVLSYSQIVHCNCHSTQGSWGGNEARQLTLEYKLHTRLKWHNQNYFNFISYNNKLIKSPFLSTLYS